MSDPDDRTPDDGGVDDEELAELADELSDVLRELRDELRASREAGEEPVEQAPVPEAGGGGSEGGMPDVPFDLPSATDVLAFTDEKLIPAAITVLEVNIKALELLQKGIRWARPDKAGENARRVRSHAESVSRSSLQRLDAVLADLQEAAGEGALPDDAEASGVIREARELRDEIDAALRERAESRGEEPDEPEPEDDEGRTSPWDDQPEVDVDVESELESIKAELGKDEDDEGETLSPTEGDGAEGEATGDDGEEDAGNGGEGVAGTGDADGSDEAGDDGAAGDGADEGGAADDEGDSFEIDGDGGATDGREGGDDRSDEG